MNKITPFLWFDDNAEDAAEFYLSVFPEAKKLGELRSSGVGPWPAGKIATVTIELMGQQMTFLNGGPAHPLTPAFSWKWPTIMELTHTPRDWPSRSVFSAVLRGFDGDTIEMEARA